MTTIGASLLITGEIISQEDITIHGCVKGQIRMEAGSLLVAPKGSVDADIEGTRITIHGTLAGSVAAGERIELTPTADVSGMLRCGRHARRRQVQWVDRRQWTGRQSSAAAPEDRAGHTCTSHEGKLR